MNSNMDLKQHHECVQRAIALGRANDPAALPELTRLLNSKKARRGRNMLFAVANKRSPGIRGGWPLLLDPVSETNNQCRGGMKMTRFMACLIAMMLVGATVRTAVSATNSEAQAAPRIAVLAEDASAESRSLADLLTADLSKAAGIQLVERAEIDRALSEQKLTAEGLVETDSRLQLGRLLKADGLVFIRKDDARETRASVRLVETRHGFLAGFYQYLLAKVTLDQVVSEATTDVCGSLSKLRADPTQMLQVAISRIGNATLRVDYDWLEDDLPALLAMTLSAEPGVLLMERRQLGEALNEARLTGDASDLKAGNVLVDGEVALNYAQPFREDSRPITVTLRFRDASLKEMGRVSLDGSLTGLDKLISEIMVLAVAKVREIGQRPSSGESAETEMLSAMARRHGYAWAADAAYALNPTNAATKNLLIAQLLKEVLASMGADHSLQNYLDRARKLARAEQLCREENSLLSGYSTQREQFDRNLAEFLSHPHTMVDAECRSVLRPVRESYRREIEAQQAGTTQDVSKLIFCAPAFFNNPLDSFSYTRRVYEAVVRSARTEEEQRKAAILAITVCAWPPEYYLDMADSSDPVIRYFALMKLLRFHGNRAKRKVYAAQAIRCFEATLQFSPGIASYYHQTIRDMTTSCPELQPLVNAKLCAAYNDLLDRKDYGTLVSLDPAAYIPLLPLTNSVPLADRLLAEREAIFQATKGNYTAKGMIQVVAEWRRETGAQGAVPACTNEPIKTLVLLEAESPEWRQSAGQLAPVPSSIEPNSEVILPQRFLIDGDILWLGLGGKVPNEPPSLNAVGLMKVDLNTGRVLSCRYGKVKGDEVIVGDVVRGRGSFAYPQSVLPLFKWHDHMVTGQNGAGVFLYPLAEDSAITDLSGVIMINVQDGLLSRQIISIAALPDRLFIMTGRGTVTYKQNDHWTVGGKGWVLSEWRQSTKTVKLIADSEKEIGGLEWPATVFLWPTMRAEATNGSLRLTFILSLKNPKGGAQNADRADYLYDSASEQWSKADPNAMSANNLRSVPSLVSADYKVTYDKQNYKGGTLAMTGFGQHWKLVFFHREGDETAARWTQARKTVPSAPPNAVAAADEDATALLIEAACAGDMAGLSRLIGQGHKIDLQNANGITPLIRAIGARQSETALWLIRQGANIALAERTGGTPLVWAAWRDQTNVVTELLSRRANPNAGFTNGQTAVMLAAANGNLGMVRQLIAKGARITDRDNAHRTAVTWAASAPKTDVLSYFLQSVTNPAALNATLWSAIESGWNQTNNLALLLKHGADINETNTWGSSLLVEAATHSEPETLQFLIDHGAKVNDSPHQGSRALMRAASGNRADNMRVLLRAGADLLYGSASWEGSSVFTYARAPEAKAVALEALGQYLLRQNQP